MKRSSLTKIITLSFALSFFSVPLHAQVYVNGQLVEGQQLHWLEAQVGKSLPAGSYWLGLYGQLGDSEEYRLVDELDEQSSD